MSELPIRQVPMLSHPVMRRLTGLGESDKGSTHGFTIKQSFLSVVNYPLTLAVRLYSYARGRTGVKHEQHLHQRRHGRAKRHPRQECGASQRSEQREFCW